ncbi:MAG TPA: glycosyltransferase [Candidatus Nanoarchaeia archaeon]|nr:glycosyltransferase [Candidatus Nanoarchaeia archaeon]
MFEIYIWTIAFISLYVSIFWIIVSSLSKNKQKPQPLKIYPKISIGVPVWNEEKTVIRSIKSLLELEYPKDKLEIIAVNDGSTDKTKTIVEEYIRKNKLKNVILISQENRGKAGALNTALRHAGGEYFGVFDADSIASKEALKLMLPYFQTEENVAAVISPIKVYDPKNVVEKIQRIEYIFTSFVRKLMSDVGTLHITHGVLSIFRKDIIEKIGGFDEKINRNLTEDLEIALRLKKNHYQIVLSEENVNYTRVPDKAKILWFQRVRWFRGFMVNNISYKDMILNKRYGLLGRFQMPLEILTLGIVFTSLGFLTYQLVKRLYFLIIKLSILKWEIFDYIKIPTLKQFILDLNIKILFPVVVSLIAGLYLYTMAHRYTKEKWSFHLVSFIYLFLYPIFRSIQWVHALLLELFQAGRKWR